ncbi:hypothetical protein SSS_01853 [Sarcoptes scabiei]|nr:hypothetical protein SSS_01853 [Sarcoptes scabiei]
MSLIHLKRYQKRIWLDLSYLDRTRALQRMQRLESFDGFGSLSMPLIGSEIENLIIRRKISAIPFVQNIIFDLSFDEYMCSLECKNLVEQLLRIIVANNQENNLENIFNLHLTGLQSSHSTRLFLNKFFNEKMRPRFPNVFIHNQSFQDIFTLDHMVYLSPHATDEIETIEPNQIYVIGGIVDRRKIIELTQTKCQRLNIKSLRLPIQNGSRKKKKLVKSLDDVFVMIKSMNKIQSLR